MFCAKADHLTPVGSRNSTRSTIGQVGTRLSGPVSRIPYTAPNRLLSAPKFLALQEIPSIGLLVSHSRIGLM
jgi:hypothetical protein